MKIISNHPTECISFLLKRYCKYHYNYLDSHKLRHILITSSISSYDYPNLIFIEFFDSAYKRVSTKEFNEFQIMEMINSIDDFINEPYMEWISYNQ